MGAVFVLNLDTIHRWSVKNQDNFLNIFKIHILMNFCLHTGCFQNKWSNKITRFLDTEHVYTG